MLSFNLWSGYKLFGLSFFDFLDYLTANIMLPLGGLFIAIFAGWLMRTSSSRDELRLGKIGYNVWLVLVRFVAPVAVLLIFLRAIDVIKLG